METHKFKKGQKVPLDVVYNLIGIIPLESYKQADNADNNLYPINDGGENITFLCDVTVKFDVKLSNQD